MSELIPNDDQLKFLIISIEGDNIDRFVKACKNNAEYPPKTVKGFQERLSDMKNLIDEIQEDISTTQRWKKKHSSF